MDFASIMQSQISKSSKPKKGAKEDDGSADSSSSQARNGNSKYVRRADLEAKRLADYQAEQEAAEKAHVERTQKRQREEEEERERAAVRAAKKAKLAEESRLRREEDERAEEAARRKRLGLPPLLDKVSGGAEEEDLDEDDTDVGEGGEDNNDIEDDELRLKLRELSAPVMLFAESHAARLRRYRRLTKPVVKMSDGPIPTSIQLIPEDELEMVPEKPPISNNTSGPGEAEDATTLQERRIKTFRLLASYFTIVFTEWEIALARRPADVKASSSGRQAQASFETARAAMVPLFRLFEQSLGVEKRRLKRARRQRRARETASSESQALTIKSPPQDSHRRGATSKDKNARSDRDKEEDPIPADVLAGMLLIVHAAQRRRYVAASDAYLTLSIGKAAWPIGVTMVGIHERSAREKLHETDGGRKAHIMSDDNTRKYLQAIKSCLAFAQTRWPPDDHLQLMG